MKKILLLAFGCLIALPAMLVAQSTAPTSYVKEKSATNAIYQAGSANAIQNERKFMIVEYFPGTDSVKAKYLVTSVRYITDGSVTYQQSPADSAILYIPQEGDRKLKGTVTWKYADQRYDTTYTLKEAIDDPATTASRWSLTNINNKAVNQSKPGVYNKSFSFVNVVSSASSAKFTSVMDRIEFFSEHFEGHGYVKIFIDGQQVSTLFQGTQPYYTDYSKLKPGFYWNFPKATPTSPAKEHTIEFKTDPGNQYIIDLIRTFTYTLKPR